MSHATTSSRPSAVDLLAVKSRVSWGALAAGAMIALSIYVLLAVLGLALGIEVAMRSSTESLGAGTAIYSIVSLLVAMFFGGWATSRLAVGESKLEAVLYGVILWGVLFAGMMWMVTAGLRTGFGAMVGVAAGTYADPSGGVDVDRISRDLKDAGIDQTAVDKYRSYYERLRDNPAEARDVGREAARDPQIRQAGREAAGAARSAAWWSLFGVIASMATIVIGSLVGSGEMMQPVPILGVKRMRTA